MEIKIANEGREASWPKFMQPMTFKNATMLFGSVNPFNKKSSVVKCSFNMISSREMIEGVKEFMRSGEFEWESAAKRVESSFEFSCHRNKVGKWNKVECETQSNF